MTNHFLVSDCISRSPCPLLYPVVFFTFNSMLFSCWTSYSRLFHLCTRYVMQNWWKLFFLLLSLISPKHLFFYCKCKKVPMLVYWCKLMYVISFLQHVNELRNIKLRQIFSITWNPFYLPLPCNVMWDFNSVFCLTSIVYINKCKYIRMCL